MNNKKITVIYILGAGRSGSTFLSAVLGASSKIFNCAELMHIYEYGCLKKICNDGYSIFESPFWTKVLKLYDPDNKVDYCQLAKNNRELEYHTSYINNIFGFTNKKRLNTFLGEQEKLFQAISIISGKAYIVDSSKYANRAILLNKSKNIDVKVIYNIRDSRGVINSFKKKVQSGSRSPLSTILYYNGVNLMSEMLYHILPKSNKIKIKYEDLVCDTTNTLNQLSSFLDINFNDVINIIKKEQDIEIGPVIEGNRMVKKIKIKINYDDEWMKYFTIQNRILYYILTFPFMTINKYKL